MWVISTHDGTDCMSAFLCWFIKSVTTFIHGENDTSLHWLHAVSDIWDSTILNDVFSVGRISIPHHFFKGFDGDVFLNRSNGFFNLFRFFLRHYLTSFKNVSIFVKSTLSSTHFLLREASLPIKTLIRFSTRKGSSISTLTNNLVAGSMVVSFS